ncbi:MAG: hypothetical protein IKD10_02660, partial [Lentisphaeria bacterium]|nr:hypothetical protein [Lentisphaeria bacterium]
MKKDAVQEPDAAAAELQAAAEKNMIDTIIAKVTAAQKEYANFSQEQVDKIFKAAAMAEMNAIWQKASEEMYRNAGAQGGPQQDRLPPCRFLQPPFVPAGSA